MYCLQNHRGEIVRDITNSVVAFCTQADALRAVSELREKTGKRPDIPNSP